MKRSTALFAALILTACAPPQPQASADLVGFEWLTGCWLSRDGAAEHWEPAIGPSMAGTSLFPQGDGTQVSQSLSISTAGSDVVLTALAPDGGEIRYVLVSSGETAAIFENAAGGGPQRLAYRRDGDTLVATLNESLAPGATSYVTRYQMCQ
ncbi:MAG: DUF6265 family protein [Hyphomonadaceae bacterium]